MSRIALRDLGAGIVLAAALVLASAAPASARPQVQILGRAEGLPSAQVHAVVQGGDGFLWFAGPNGLVRYEGWRLTALRGEDGLTSHGLRSLALGDGDRLWIGTDAGVDVRQPDGRIQPLVNPDTWTYGFVEALAPGPGGSMWLATAGGLLSWSGAQGVRPVEDPQLRGRLVTDVVTDPRGRTWAAVSAVGLLLHTGDDRWRKLAPDVETLFLSPRATLWAGGEEGLIELDLESGERRGDGPEPAGRVTAILETADELWLGVDRELRRYQRGDGGWSAPEVMLDGALVNDLAVDDLGNVWIATDNLGVAKISALRSALRQMPMPCETQVYSIRPAGDGTYLVGGDTCSWTLDARGERPLEVFEGLDRVKVWDLIEDRDGGLWAATEEGLLTGRGRRPRAVGVVELLRDPGRALLARSEELWVGSVTGLAYVEGERVGVPLVAGGRSLGYVYTLEEDADGRLWAGTLGNGLWRQDAGGRFEPLRGEHLDERSNVYSVAFGPRGRVVVSHDSRLVVLEEDGTSWTLPSATGDAVAAWSLRFDDQGVLWAGGSSGLVRYDLEERQATLRLTGSMGLGGEEFTTSRSLALTPRGHLLCGLASGLAVVEIDGLEDFRQPPVAQAIEIVWTNAEVTRTDDELLVRQGPWTVDVRVAAPWFLDERSLSYRHRLRGFDGDWSRAGAGGLEQIRYTGLPPGSYVLEAQAHSPLAGWGPAVEVMRLRVLPPWWQTPWALLAGVALAAAAAFGLWRWRNRFLIRRSQELEHQVVLRTQELQLALGKLEHLATHDGLTGLPNQRSFWHAARRHLELAQRHGTGFALIVVDLDDFKRVNDTYGHRVGDDVLIFAAQRLAQTVRDADLVARYGGEEFVALLPQSSETEAVRAAERMRAALAAKPYVTQEGDAIALTGSFGVSSWQGPEDGMEDLFQRADQAVYAAKETKDSVALWSPELETLGVR